MADVAVDDQPGSSAGGEVVPAQPPSSSTPSVGVGNSTPSGVVIKRKSTPVQPTSIVILLPSTDGGKPKVLRRISLTNVPGRSPGGPINLLNAAKAQQQSYAGLPEEEMEYQQEGDWDEAQEWVDNDSNQLEYGESSAKISKTEYYREARKRRDLRREQARQRAEGQHQLVSSMLEKVKGEMTGEEEEYIEGGKMYCCSIDWCRREFDILPDFLFHVKQHKLNKIRRPAPGQIAQEVDYNEDIYQQEAPSPLGEVTVGEGEEDYEDSWSGEDDIVRQNKMPDTYYNCAICDTRFPTARAVNMHERQLHGDEIRKGNLRIPCRFCKCSPPESATNKTILTSRRVQREHERKVHRAPAAKDPDVSLDPTVDTFVCTVCNPNRGFVSREQLEHHEATYHPTGGQRQWVRQFACEECGEVFLDSKDMASHQLKAHDLQWEEYKLRAEYRCPKCPVAYKLPYKLSLHIVEEHDPNGTFLPKGSQFACWVCKKGFQTKCGVNTHVESAHSDKGPMPFACNHCGRRYATKHNWRKHVRSHTTGIEYLICKGCGKRYLHTNSLSYHQRSCAGMAMIDSGLLSGSSENRSNRMKGAVERLAAVPDSGKQIECIICGHMVYSQRGMAKHCRMMHPNVEIEKVSFVSVSGGELQRPHDEHEPLNNEQLDHQQQQLQEQLEEEEYDDQDQQQEDGEMFDTPMIGNAEEQNLEQEEDEEVEP